MTDKLHIGLLLPSREAVLWAGGDTELLIEIARLAEQAGYDSVWAGDSLIARPRCEPLTLLAAVGAVTTRVGLGTAVLLPLLRHPLNLGHTLASIDRITGGRLVVGVGPGADVPGTHAELAALGVPSHRRVADMLEAIERCRRVWRGEEPGIEVLPRPMSPGGPPMWLAGQGPRMLDLAGAAFDGWLAFSPTPDDYARGLRSVREAAERAGRDPEAIATGAYLTVAIADHRHRATSELDAYMRAYYGLPGDVIAQIQACHGGTIASAADWLLAYSEAGARHLVIRLARPELGSYHDTACQLLTALQ